MFKSGFHMYNTYWVGVHGCDYIYIDNQYIPPLEFEGLILAPLQDLIQLYVIKNPRVTTVILTRPLFLASLSSNPSFIDRQPSLNLFFNHLSISNDCFLSISFFLGVRDDCPVKKYHNINKQ